MVNDWRICDDDFWKKIWVLFQNGVCEVNGL